MCVRLGIGGGKNDERNYYYDDSRPILRFSSEKENRFWSDDSTCDESARISENNTGTDEANRNTIHMDS